ncbi:MAG: hypothetical protein IKR22_00030 [Clostridiales bacterium]|nr:hypothetical protein [Clostridiales bacterium]
MNRRLICVFISLTILTCTAAGCRKKTDAHGKVTDNSVKVQMVSDSERDSDDSPIDSSDSTSAAEDTAETTSYKDGELDPDRVLFTQEYTNMAWGYQSEVIVVMGDGRYYVTSNKVSNSASGDYDSRLAENIKAVTQTEAEVFVEHDYLMKMNMVASQVDPNARKTSEYAMNDYGQENLYYWDENGNKVLCASKGDVKYTIDDSNAKDVEQLWEHLFEHLTDANGNGPVQVYADYSAPIKTIHCGYVELPDGSSGKYVFKNYDEFLKAAEEWGLDLDELNITSNAYYLNQPVFVQFDLFNTMGHNREYFVLATDGDSYFFIKSKNCSDPAPDDMVPQALDGFVTVGICTAPDIDQDLTGIKTEDGSEWELYKAS